MTTEQIVFASITAVVAILSVVFAWTGRGRDVKKECVEDAQTATRMEASMEYVKRGVDDIRVEQRLQRQEIGSLCDRVARVEESSKSAHKRMDEHIKEH
jgi:uncharacterized membrane protein